MQVSKHIHALRIPFKLPIAPGKELDRFAYAFVIYGRNKICLIDSGVAGSKDLIFDYISKTGRSPEEISLLVFTHAHPDHIGGALEIQRATGCVIAAHEADAAWIENTELQFKERAVPGFHSIVEGSVKVDRRLQDGDMLNVDEGLSLRVIHTPGHSRGHISLLLEPDHALFSGDSIPLRGTMPIYEDAVSSVASVARQRDISGLEVLLSSWDEPRFGGSVYETIGNGIAYLREIHAEVMRAGDTLGTSDTVTVAKEVWRRLGLPEFALNPLLFKSVESHLKTGRGEL